MKRHTSNFRCDIRNTKKKKPENKRHKKRVKCTSIKCVTTNYKRTHKSMEWLHPIIFILFRFNMIFSDFELKIRKSKKNHFIRRSFPQSDNSSWLMPSEIIWLRINDIKC